MTLTHPDPAISSSALDAASPALLLPVDHRNDARDRSRLRRALALLQEESECLGRSLGLSAEWGTTRWLPGPQADMLVAQYRVRVTGSRPTAGEVGRLVRRLARDGWNGAVHGHDAVIRLDCHRGDLELCLTAHDGTVSLVVTRAPWRVGRSLAARALVGVFEELR